MAHSNVALVSGKDFSPVSWEGYFEELFYLDKGTSVFRAGNNGAIFFCMHGAGHSALSFATLAK
jgi:protein phosphatase methylesterase 1